MLYQIGLVTFQNVEKIRLYIQNFAKKNYKKIPAISMAAKIASIFVILAFVPATAGSAHRETYKTAVKLDTNSAQAVVGKDRQVNIETGVSLADAANKRVSTKVAS